MLFGKKSRAAEIPSSEFWWGTTAISGAITPGLGALTAPDAATAPLITTTLTFDQIPGFSGDFMKIPRGYGNLQWIDFGAVNPTTGFGPPDQFPGDQFPGFFAGLVSHDRVGYTAFSSDALPTITSGGGNFNFRSAWLTSGAGDGLIVDINAYDGGVLKYHQTLTLDDDAATRFIFNFKNIDTITFVPSVGATGQDPDNVSIVFDNVVINSLPGAISGVVFNDRNGNGEQDLDEKGLTHQIVFVDLNHNGIKDPGEYSAVTAANGSYTITGVPFGTYDVVHQQKNGFSNTSPPPLVRDDYSFVVAQYDFIDIAQPRNRIFLSNLDDGYTVFVPSIPISFYGEDRSRLYILANGLITLDTNGLGSDTDTNTTLPNPKLLNTLIAPLWEDYDLNVSGKVYAFDDTANDRVIVEWKDVARYGDSETDTLNTFEAIIYYDGRIEFQYLQSGLIFATVGVENGDGSIGTQISIGSPPTDHSAYTLTPIITTKQDAISVVVDSAGTTSNIDFGSIFASDTASQMPASVAIDREFAAHPALILRADTMPV